MRVRYIYTLLALLLWFSVSAQNVAKLEYFIDTDPGFGMGTNVPITPGQTISDHTFNISITSLSEGFHTLFIRSKNANGNWSMTHFSAFYKLPNTVGAAAPNISKLEYFIDTDPGHGMGTNVPITPGQSIANLTFNISISSLSEGFHTLFIRSKNATGNWSMTHFSAFYKLPNTVGAALPSISKLEYFIDTDPGYGSGTSVAITPSTSISDLVFNIDVTALSEASHKLFVRAKDQSGRWSIVNIADFEVCHKPAPVASAATLITATGFTANWGLVSGATTYLLDVSKDNFATYVTGFQAKSYITNSGAVTGLTQATSYQFRVRAVVNCTTVYSNIISVTTPVATPTASPSNIQFANPTTSSFTVAFSAASGSPTGYLAVRKAGSASTFVPQNDTEYTAGQNVTDGVIAYKGSNITFLQSALTSGSLWYYTIYSYNQVGSLISYRTTSPLQGNYYTQAVEPATQPTALTFQSVTSTSYTGNFTGATGSPDGYLVFRKTGSAPTFVPVDATTYTLNSNYGDSKLVAVGANTTFNETGLTQLTNYHYAVYAYNGSGLPINYRSTSPLTGNVTTALAEPTAQPTNIAFTNVTSNAITVSYSAAAGSPAGYLVLRRAGSSSTFVPVYNSAYTVGQQVTTGVFVAYTGPNVSFTDGSLLASTVYHYDVFAYNQSGALISYRTLAPLEGSTSTFTAEPSAQPSNINFSNITATAMRIGFTPANPAPSGYLAIRNTATASTFTPVDGTSYSLGQNVTNGIVVFNGAATSFDDAGLLPGTTYAYTIFSYNGSGTATNYVETLSASNTGVKITVPGKPNVGPATNVQQTSFTANWSAITGASSYRLDVSEDNFVSRVAGFDNLTVNGLASPVTGLKQGTAYKYRVRAVNESGTSVNSDESQQFTVPATPVTNSATNVTQTSFTASWNAVVGASGYFIDVSLDDFVTYATGFQNASVNTTSVSATGLTAGKTYKYRVRANNSGGTSPSSTPPTQQLLKPATPLGQDAANVTSSSFKSKWAIAEGATEYRLDVTLADNNFNPSLNGYSNKLILNTEELVTGLLPNTVYRYRVRAVNATGTSPDSSPISVATEEAGVGASLQITNPVFNPAFSASSEKVSIDIVAGTPPYVVRFFHRQISKTIFTEVAASLETVSTYSVSATPAMADEVGTEFYFSVSDGTGATKDTNLERIYVAIPDGGIKIPFTRSGGTLQSYELFSIPYEFTGNDNLIESIFDEMGAYDKAKWRLVRYQGGKNVDFGAGINRIEQGKGYWFNRKERTEIFISDGTVTKVNQDQPFSVRLEVGWNQIGNPMPFNVSWSELIAANNNNPNIGELKVYQSETTQLINSDDLQKWSGGFVHNDGASAFNLFFPMSLRGNIGGRVTSERITGNDIDEEEWIVPITISKNNLPVNQSGFGMHPNALASKDWYDDLVPPRWGEVLELYVFHDEFFTPKFQRDVVPTQTDFSWSFILESEAEEQVVISWNSSALVNTQADLFLVDERAGRIVNMKKQSSYAVDQSKRAELKFIYSRNGEFMPSITLLGDGFPNPSQGTVHIPFVLSDEYATYTTALEIFDLRGKKVKGIAGRFSPGIHEEVWDGNDTVGNPIANGMYIIKMKVNGTYLVSFTKVIIQRRN